MIRWRIVAVAALLVGILAAGWALRIDQAGEQRAALSADERSYVRIAEGLQRDGTYGDGSMRDPFHWAPGAATLFALAASSDATRLGDTSAGAGPLRTAQALVSTATVLAVFGLAALLAGAWAGLAAAAVMAFYPPAISLTSGFLSEPLGALGLAAAALALAWAWRGGRAGRFALAGAAIGLACLARADTLPAALLLPPLCAVLLVRACGWRGAVVRGALLAGSAAAVLAPWVVHVSTKTGAFVPVTSGGGSTLYIATSLEGGGTLTGTKRALHAEACEIHPTLCDRQPYAIRAEFLLDAVAARHPSLSRDEAMRREARANIDDGLDRPGLYAAMFAGKLERLWWGYFRGRNTEVNRASLLYHRAIVVLGVMGLLAGLALARGRRGLLGALCAALVACTALNAFYVAETRHNARMVPVLIAVGTAGWVLAVRTRSRGEEHPPKLASQKPLG